MDIYFEEDYAKLYEESEKGKLEIFEFNNKKGSGKTLFIKREISEKIFNHKYYDIVTPYGYGGPIFNIYSMEDKKDFIKEYCEKFQEYCLKNNIISEFIRFHPLEKNHKNLENFYKISHVSETIFIDLSSKDNVLKNMSSQSRNKIKKALKNDLVFEEDKEFKTLEIFKKLYYETMKKNNANNMYFFNDKYFFKLFNIKNKVKLFNIKLNEKIISSSIILLGDRRLHYHLSANTSEGYKFAANNFLLYNISLWGIEKKYQYFHLGGGYGGNKSPLFKFKKSINENGELKFYIGKKIYNRDIYDTLVEKSNLNSEEKKSDYFPLYRLKGVK